MEECVFKLACERGNYIHMNMYRLPFCFWSGYDGKHYMPMNVKYSVLSGKKRVKSVAELGKNLLSLMYQIYVC